MKEASCDLANACTELTRPVRVKNVPSIDMARERLTRTIFQTLSMPRFSCTMIECKKAVPVHQGINDDFSTGSHPQ